MTIAGDSTRTIEVKSYRGIEGSTAINAIPEGFCLELENATLGQKGEITKRVGYNQWGCELPIRCRKATYVPPGAETKAMRLQLDSTPIMTLECTFYKNSLGKLNTLVPEYFNSITDDFNNTVIAVFTSLPSTIVITLDSLFEFSNGTFIKPVFIANTNTVLFPISVLNLIGSAKIYNAVMDNTFYYYNYSVGPDYNNVAWSEVVSTAYRPLIHSGVSLESVDGTYFSSMTMTNSTEIVLTSNKDTGLSVGDTIFFECNLAYDSVGAGVPTDYKESFGFIYKIVGNDIYVFLRYSSVLSTSINYFRMAVLRGRAITLVTGPMNVSANVLYNYQPFSFNDTAQTIITTNAGYTWSNLLRPFGVNLIQSPTSLSASLEKIMFIFGTRVSPGYAGALNKYYNKDIGREILVSSVCGNIYEETDNNISFSTLEVSEVTATHTAVISAVTMQGTFLNIPFATSNYMPGDTIFRVVMSSIGSAPIEESYTVVSTIGTSIVVLSSSYTGSVVIPKGTRWRIRRLSNRIYFSGLTTTIDNKLVPGMSIQVDNAGNDYNSYTIEHVSRSSSFNQSFITINDTITWESDSTVYLGPVWEPIFYGTGSTYTYAPLSSAQFDQNSRDLYSTNFDYAVYIAAGVDSIWRYDGREVTDLRLPAPPLAYWRTIPGTFGNLPAKIDETGNAVGQEVTVLLTYIYTDNFGRDYESPVSPDSDITFMTSPIGDGTDTARLVEIRVPSIPINIGFPADRIRIRAYRQFTSPVKKITRYRMDAEVFNDYNSALTSIIVGKTSQNYALDNEELYTESEIYSNRPSPLADVVTVLNNKLVALGGYELPKFEIVCRQVFASENVSGSFFSAWFRIDYNNLINKSEVLSFCTIPLAKAVSATEAYSDSDLPAAYNYPASTFMPGFKIKKTLPYAANALFTLSNAAGHGVKYTDESHIFRLLGTGATAVTATTAKLRTVGGQVSADINFNRDVFTTVSASVNDIILHASTKWNTSNTKEVIGTDTTRVCFFEQVAAISSDRVGLAYTTGPVTPTMDGGIIIVSHKDLLPVKSAVQLKLNPALGVTLSVGATRDLIILQMDKQVAGAYPEDTLGDIVYGSSASMSFNSEITFKVTQANPLVDAIDGYHTYNLEIVDNLLTSTLKTNAVPTTSVLPRLLATDTVAGHGEFKVFVRTNEALDPVLKTSSFTKASREVEIGLAVAPAGISLGDTISVDFFTTNGISAPDFNAIGYPTIKGSFKVKALNVGAGTQSVTIEVDKAPQKAVQSATHQYGAQWGGAITVLKNYISVDTSAHTLSVRLDIGAALATTDCDVGDWHFLCFRGWEFNSVCSQISGWFKIKSFGVGGNADVVVYEYNGSNYDINLLSGITLARVMYMISTTSGTVTTRYVPIPVPYQNGLSEEIFDLAWPMFEQRSDALYTPLMAVARRFALCFNSVLREYGFAFWGGTINKSVDLYPVNGMQFVSHKYPINRYRAFNNGTYTRPTIELTDYNEPWDKFEFRSVGADYYKVFGNIKESTGYLIKYVYPVVYNNADASTKYTLTYVSPYQGSRIWWSSFVNNKDISNRITVFKYRQTEEINSADGENIVGAVPYQNYLAIFKKNSIFRTNLDQLGEKIEVERAQSTVGSLSGKNLIATESYLYFVHESGVYFLSGLNVEPETTLNRYFNERVYQNAALLPFTSGYHSPLSKEIVIGVPYSPDENTRVSTVDGQFLYNYNEGVFGWSVNLNFPATWWIRRLNENYFTSIYGKVFKIRSERDNTKYRDYEDPIAFKLRTRYINMDSEVSFKFIRNFILQLGTSTDMNVAVNYTWDYFKLTTPLTIIPLTSASYQTSPYAGRYFVSNKYLKPVRGMVTPNRVAQLGLEITNAEIDAKLEVFGVYIEGQVTNNRLITQKNQKR